MTESEILKKSEGKRTVTYKKPKSTDPKSKENTSNPATVANLDDQTEKKPEGEEVKKEEEAPKPTKTVFKEFDDSQAKQWGDIDLTSVLAK